MLVGKVVLWHYSELFLQVYTWVVVVYCDESPLRTSVLSKVEGVRVYVVSRVFFSWASFCKSLQKTQVYQRAR